MSSKKYSDIYEGNWSYSFYGGEQGILFTERKDVPISAVGQTVNFTLEERSMSLERANNMRNASQGDIGDRLSVRAYPPGLEAKPQVNMVNVGNRQYDTEQISPALSREGSNQAPFRRVQLRNNTPGPAIKNKQELAIVENIKTTGNFTTKQDMKSGNEAFVEIEGVSPDTPRPGTGQILVRGLYEQNNLQNNAQTPGIVKRSNNNAKVPVLDIRNSREPENVHEDNMKEEKMTIGQDHDNMVKSDVNERNIGSDEMHSNKTFGRTEKEIEELRKRLRQKSSKKEVNRAQQRELLRNWVAVKSKGEQRDINQTRHRSRSTSDVSRTGRAIGLEDIVEDDATHSDEGSGKRSASTDGNFLYNDPPPLPPRHTRGNSLSSLGSDVRRKHAANRRKNRSSLPLELPISDIDNQMVSPRSPAVRKRDAMQRRYNSTSALFGSTVSSVDDADYDAPSRDTLVLRRTSSRTDESSTDEGLKNGSSGGSCPTSPAPVFGSDANYFSAQHYDGDTEDHLDKVDIVGESFEARYPWQRDVSTQCNIAHLFRTSTSSSRTSCTSWTSQDSIDTPTPSVGNVNSPAYSPELVLRKKTSAFRQKRPHSIGCMDNMIYEAEMEKLREINSRRVRHSEPLIQHTPGLYPDSVSDLESILENPREGTVDSSRNNSIISEDGVSADELSSLLKNPQNGRTYLDVLPSPRVSPEMWSNVPDVIVNAEDDHGYDKDNRHSSSGSQYLEVPCKLPRRKSSGSITSGSDDSDVEPSPPVVRRGRRAAIVDTKNFGDVSPTTLSPEVSPSNSCDEGDGASNIAGRLRRRRSSVDLAMSIYPGDLLVQEHHKKLIKRNTISDFYAGRNGSTPSLNEDNKKARQPFSLLKLMKTRSKESLSHLGDLLTKMKPSEFKDNHLAAYKSVHWTDLIASTDKETNVADSLNISEMERKRRETVWELFKSECVFLIDHLMVLKHCFLEPLKKVQVEGFLMYAEPSDIFSNLDELCYVSYTFCKDFIAGLVKEMSATDFGRTSILIKAFQRFSTHSKDGEVYHSYCLNYTNALNYLETLRKNDDFCEFEKWCEQDSRCNRLQLADLLISPMQHCTKLPLLLYNIKKYTENPTEKQQIADSIQKVEASLQQLEDKMKWLKNFERVQEIQRHLVWPHVTDLDPRAFIPEYLKSKLSQQPCERLLACPRRQLIHEGAISLTESTKTHDAYLFLFDDILLITKIKKPNRKKQTASDQNHSKQNSSSQPDRQTYIVHRQPIALDRFGIHDVSPSEAAANGLKYAFVLVQISRFQQIIDVFTLQAPTELVKSSWVVQIREAKRRYNSANLSRESSLKEEDIVDNNNRESFCKDHVLQQQQTMDSIHTPPTSVRRRSGSSVKRIQHGKSLSVDAIFL